MEALLQLRRVHEVGGRNLRATHLLSLRSSALQTIPIPPWPTSSTIRYLPDPSLRSFG
jgi:hypothetical protein